MESKVCKKCEITKPVNEFGKHTSTKDRLNPKCKKCVREYYKLNKTRMLTQLKVNYLTKRDKKIQYAKDLQISLKDGVYSVYLLPEENYVGVTDNLTVRKRGHKHSGRNVKGMRVLYQFFNRQDALELEAFCHELGYKGGKY